MHPTIEALHFARDAARLGRKREAGAILVEITPDFEYKGRRRKALAFESFEGVLRTYCQPHEIRAVSDRPNPLLSMLRKT